MNKTILWIAAGAAAIFLLSRLQLARRVNFLFGNIRPGGTLLQPSIVLEIIVQNPTNQQAIFQSLTGNLEINGRNVANISNFQRQTIAPLAESTIRINARPNAIGVFSTIKDLLTSQTGSNQVFITGSAMLDGIQYPLNISRTV